MKFIIPFLFAATCICSKVVFAFDLYKIERLDPKSEAIKVARSDDVFFLGVWGYSLMVLEVPGNPYCWREVGMVREVPNTSDAVIDASWQHLAEKFAVSFNTTILALRPELKSHKCAHNN